MDSKIVKRKMLLVVSIITIGVYLISCKTLTVKEFMDKYDEVEVEGEITDFYHSATRFTIIYNNQKYLLSLSAPPYLAIGRKYKILIDKKNPDKHYLVLLYKPIPIDTVPIVEGQIYITDYYKGTNEVWVYNKAIGMGGDSGKVYFAREEFFEDIKYYDAIKKYKEEGARVVIDAYLLQQLSDNKSRVIFKINYKKTDELNGYDNH